VTAERFQEITGKYPSLRIAVVGDYSCDRYLEIDPTREETSIETGLPVHNITNVRAQPGAAGTVLANLSALGVGELWRDGEGYELQRALEQLPGVKMNYFFESKTQRTFTYCKPLMMEPGQPPRELSRLDSKNWHHTPKTLQKKLADGVRALAGKVDAFVILDQVDEPETGVVTQNLLATIDEIKTQTLVIGDSRRGLKNWPHVIYKMNADELARFTDGEPKTAAVELAQKTGKPVFVSVAENGIHCANPNGETTHSPALPVRGAIDIVGAGDAVTANLAAALATDAELPEALELANRAASIVIHKLGTTGTASVSEIGVAGTFSPNSPMG
jgi:bifunctional ADP-heptose synthase (sugar kinase/adenylyltransferase)